MKNARNPEHAGPCAVAYLRASSDDQRLSPSVQRAAIESWAAKEGVTVVSWHIDQGVSGGKDLDERPGLIAALAELKVRTASTLIVQRRDRLARDVYIAATIERAVERVGARVVSADRTGNGETPADAFMRTILDAAAQYERALIRARTRAALREKRAKATASAASRLGSPPTQTGSSVHAQGSSESSS